MIFIYFAVTLRCMLVKTQAIVLHSFRYGENKMIVELFTRTHGRLSFIAGIPASGKGRVRKQYFQPLSVIELEADVRPKASLQKIKDVRMAYAFSSIPFEPHKLGISLFVAEFLCYALRSEQQNVPLFEYISDSILWLDGCRGSFSNFHLVFLMRLSRFLGFYPNLDDYAEGDYFDMRQSCFCMQPPVHRDVLPPQEASVIRILMRMDYATMHLYRMSRHERNRCVEAMVLYYRLHLPGFSELRSLSVLQELYQ